MPYRGRRINKAMAFMIAIATDSKVENFSLPRPKKKAVIGESRAMIKFVRVRTTRIPVERSAKSADSQ